MPLVGVGELRNAKILAFGVWPSFTEVSVVSKLLGVTLKQDGKRDRQVSALEDRLCEVEDKFRVLDSKVSAITDPRHGGALG